MKVWTVYWAQRLRTRHYMTKSALIFLLSVFILVFIGGCGEKLPEGLPKLVPVKMTVIQDGNPLEGVLFRSSRLVMPVSGVLAVLLEPMVLLTY